MGTHLWSLKSNLRKKKNIMQIFVKGEATEALQVSPQTTVGQLQAMTAEAGRMMANGTILDNADATLEDFGIQAESTIQIVAPVLGGGRKKKKHKRTNVKLATLKLYKVDDVGKLERKRKECPQEMCGAGIFLSNHKDRQYCGKCGLTIKYNEQK